MQKFINFIPYSEVNDTVKIPKKSDLAFYGNEHKRKVLLRWIRMYKLRERLGQEGQGIDLGNGYLIP